MRDDPGELQAGDRRPTAAAAEVRGLAHQVGKVHAGGMDSHLQFLRRGFTLRKVMAQLQVGAFDDDGFHR